MKSKLVLWRDRATIALEKNQWFIGLELLMAVGLQMLHVFRIVPTATPFLLALGWLSLWLRKSGWRQMGLSRPAHWPRTIGLGLAAAIIFQAFSIWVVVPVAQQFTHESLDLSQFQPLRSNIAYFLVALVVSWVYAALLEEMVYRGYLLNRLKDFVGGGRIGWVVAALGSAALFGAGHAYQGASGIVDTFLSACLMTALYFIGKRNLWPAIIAHGAKDTIGFALIFLGLYP